MAKILNSLSSEVVKKKTSKDYPKHLFVYEPKKVPVLDKDGNVIAYDDPVCFANDLKSTKPLRKAIFPNELGVSANPENVTGYRRLIDVLNQSKNLHCYGTSSIGRDDVSVFVEAERTSKILKQN